MKKVIKHGKMSLNRVFILKCLYCDCEFQYSSSDIERTFDRNELRLLVRCPECNRLTPHKEGSPCKMSTESFNTNI